MHATFVLGAIRQITLFRNGQSVDVRAQADGWSGLGTANDRYRREQVVAGAQFKIERSQKLPDESGGFFFLPT
jgi:hypothetical protein